ncbi:MAG: glycosyltransferase family 4 protein [Proteobacteria bacterium]|nr:glycosyltransferase family 4 protein [Pseudomonadota bacterium]
MRIAGTIFESLTKAGGYEIFTYNLFKTLARRGHEVCLYLPHRELRKRSPFYQNLPFETRPMIRCTHSVLKRAPWLLQWYLAREQKRHNYAVWQAMGAYPEAFATLRVHAPKVLRNYGEDVQIAPNHSYGMRSNPALADKVVQGLTGMDRIIAMTESLATLQHELGVDPARIRRVPNGVNTTRFQTPRDRNAIREAWNIPPDVPVILTVGRNHAKKGFDLIPAMASRLISRGLDFCWLVVGGQTEKLHPAILSAGVADKVRPIKSLGANNTAMDLSRLELPVDELLEIYAMADLFVLPSRLEGFSRVIIEAMAAGLPVVTTDAPGCCEVFTDGTQGLIRPVDNTEALAEAVGTLLADAPLRHSMSQAAREHSLAFDWSTIAAAYESVYQELVEE